MEELLLDTIMNGESLVKDILNTDGVSSITDDNGKSYWWDTIDKAKKYQVRKYEYDRALQDYSVISYKIKELSNNM
jgi:hypothetical protein